MTEFKNHWRIETVGAQTSFSWMGAEFHFSYDAPIGVTNSHGSFIREKRFSITTSKHQSRLRGTRVDEDTFEREMRRAWSEIGKEIIENEHLLASLEIAA